MFIVTGFESFAKFKSNPSERIAKYLEEEYKEVRAEIVPVKFEEAKEYARKIIGQNPEAVISFGLADGKPQISIEKIAVNIMDSSTPDNSGFKPFRMKIFDDGEDAYSSTLPVYRILDALHDNGIPAYISYTAGTYVCNTLFYSLLYYARKMGKSIPVGFVHLPSTEKMALKRRVPYVEYETMKMAAKIILDVIYRLFSPWP